MSSIEQHCADCKKQKIKPWKKVHVWLDEFAAIKGVPQHRRVRHHKEGVEEIRKMWGDEAAQAAEIHIRRDLFFWGNEIPTQSEYKNVEKAYINAACSIFGKNKRDRR